ncbi:MAG: imidazoleglycerol-phosphate dehydratase HisB [Clostridia bacterium]|nr:imidazoleglycerol-phosphate dehydratase HisB [Clostridia bacterium]
MRENTVGRKTAETDISLYLNLDGAGKSKIDTGCGFLDHMLTLFAAHGKFDLTVKCVGDTYVDYHHTVEDVGIALGEAFKNALGDKKGINRYGDCTLVMDEAVVLSAIDFSGRVFLEYDLKIPAQKVGDFDTELTEEFFFGFVRKSESSLHLKTLSGKNSHHIIEGAFKSFAKSVRKAVAVDEKFKDVLPSTKGVL